MSFIDGLAMPVPKPVKSIRAGQLRDLVRLEERVENVDAAGGVNEPSWRFVAKFWADISQIVRRSAEGLHSQQIMGPNLYTVYIRFRTDVTIKHRLVVIARPDEPLNILGLGDPDGRRRQLILTCQGGLTSG